MYAMILAAGRGERMRPLTDRTPKPLLQAGDRRLIEHLLQALADGGITDIVINHAHLGAKLVSALGDGSVYGVDISYSAEPDDALETGGGILRAIPLLRSDPFLVVNGDIWTDYPFATISRDISGLAHVVLVNNPEHNKYGDFVLDNQWVFEPPEDYRGPTLTFGGIGIYRKSLFSQCTPGRFPLAPLLIGAMASGQVTGEHFKGEWVDVGTPERLAKLDKRLRTKRP